MYYKKYPVEASASLLQYEFCSKGPKGPVKKQITYQAFEDTPDVHNLAFGDVDENGHICDTVVTDNSDGEKVLATVAFTLYQFFKQYPDCYVFASGSTPARTRLYRMGISRNLAEINVDFQVFGWIDSKWEVFERNRNYEAYLVKKK